jgi:hypothetical protein
VRFDGCSLTSATQKRSASIVHRADEFAEQYSLFDAPLLRLPLRIEAHLRFDAPAVALPLKLAEDYALEGLNKVGVERIDEVCLFVPRSRRMRSVMRKSCWALFYSSL